VSERRSKTVLAQEETHCCAALRDTLKSLLKKSCMSFN